MGANKALLDLEGRSFLARVAAAVVPICPDLVLSVGTERDAPADVVERLRREVESVSPRSLTISRDRAARMGPVGGMAAALAHAKTQWAFVTACDSPLLSTRLVEGLVGETRDDVDLVLPIRNGRPEPLLAVYRVATMAVHYQAQLDGGGGSPLARLEDVRVLRVDHERLRALDPDEGSFLNVNDPTGYDSARRRLAD